MTGSCLSSKSQAAVITSSLRDVLVIIIVLEKCFAAVLDQINPVPMGTKARGARVFDELVKNGYVVTD